MRSDRLRATGRVGTALAWDVDVHRAGAAGRNNSEEDDGGGEKDYDDGGGRDG